jgi:MoaA/NifB/PqqE/SkfB family radical SAM enzyme
MNEAIKAVPNILIKCKENITLTKNEMFLRILSQDAKRNIREQLIGRPIPKQILLYLTNKCGNKCGHCYQNKNNEGLYMDYNTASKVIEQSFDLGVAFIGLYGGEPTEWGGLPKLVNQYNKTIFLLYTNGDNMQSEVFINKISRNVIPIISVEGGEELHEYIRGKGKFNKIISIFNLLKENGFKYSTITTVTNKNIDYVFSKEYIGMLKNLEIVALIYSIYRGQNKEYVINKNDYNKIKILSKKVSEELPVELFPRIPIEECCNKTFEELVVVGPEGDIGSCPFTNYTYGNINNDSLEAIIKSKKNLIFNNRWALQKNDVCQDIVYPRNL